LAYVYDNHLDICHIVATFCANSFLAIKWKVWGCGIADMRYSDMISIEMLRKQHADILEQIDAIVKSIKENKDDPSKEMVRELLANLSAELELHLLIEDDLLYPTLMKDSRESIRNVAHMFVIELSGVKEAFKKYKAKWASHDTIAVSLEAFISETKAIVALLRKRIDKENNELFPLLENRPYGISSLPLV
jgi:hemerythrin-like domain-containing protein